MNQYYVRIAYIFLSIVGVWLSYRYYGEISGEISTYTKFSYIGTVATLIALLIAVAEIMHNLYVSKSIQEEAATLLNRVKTIENASSISDCLAAIDDVSVNVSHEDYKLALKSFHFFRKVCVKVIPHFGDSDDDNLNPLGELELILIKATHTSPSAPFSKKQKTDLMKQVLFIKQRVEKMNPARGDSNVTG